jgi:hypothetical protein
MKWRVALVVAIGMTGYRLNCPTSWTRAAVIANAPVFRRNSLRAREPIVW